MQDVIFDRYAGIRAKDHERQRIAGEGSAQYQMYLTSTIAARERNLYLQSVPTRSLSSLVG